MELDEAQEFRKLARDIAERAKIYHEELVKSNLHQDQCYIMTQQFAHREMNLMRSNTPEIDNRALNKIIEQMGSFLTKQIGDDDDA